MNKIDTALKKFNNGYNCCQSILTAYKNYLDISEKQAIKISSGFGGGMQKGEVCGAVTGAIMIIGLHYNNKTDLVKNKVKQFLDTYEKQQGSVLCKDILAYDISNENDYKIIKQKNLFKTKCPQAIKNSILVLETVL